MIPDWVMTSVILIATLVWLGNFLAAVFQKDYEASEAINAIMLALIGGLFALRKGKGKEDDDDDE